VVHILSLLLRLPVEPDHLENCQQIKDNVAHLSLRKADFKEDVRLMADQLLNQWYQIENKDELQMTYDEEGNFQEEYRQFSHLVNSLATANGQTIE
jgi:hypothetical protein